MKQVDRLRTALTARRWDIEYCKFIAEIYVCAGMRESEAARVLREVCRRK